LTSTVPRLPTLRVDTDAAVLDELDVLAGVDEAAAGLLELEALPHAAATRPSGRASRARALIRASLGSMPVGGGKYASVC
jgi:hypothetical protein